jgi:lysophospholipase L1-like esterase
MKSWFLLLLLALTATAAAADDQCAVPVEMTAEVRPLPRVKATVVQRQPLTVLTLGGASTGGAAAGAPEFAYPARLEALLGQRFPNVPIEVVNAGRPRETTRLMVERLQGLLIAHRPQLVIWETGTADAVRRGDPGAFGQYLAAGVDFARARSADVILMDFQYGRGASALIDFEPYLERLEWAATMKGVALFRRHDMMRFWSDSGLLDLSERQGDKQRKMAAVLYDCIARRVDEMIGRAVK